MCESTPVPSDEVLFTLVKSRLRGIGVNCDHDTKIAHPPNFHWFTVVDANGNVVVSTRTGKRLEVGYGAADTDMVSAEAVQDICRKLEKAADSIFGDVLLFSPPRKP